MFAGRWVSNSRSYPRSTDLRSLRSFALFYYSTCDEGSGNGSPH